MTRIKKKKKMLKNTFLIYQVEKIYPLSFDFLKTGSNDFVQFVLKAVFKIFDCENV